VIVVGIDPHKQSHTAVAISAVTGEIVGERTVSARDAGHMRLVGWLVGMQVTRVGIEDVRHVSGRLERALIESGLVVVRVPPGLTGQARRTGRTRGKSDSIDATAVARATLAHPELPVACLAGPELDLHLLVSHREDLVAERTRIQQRLRWHLHALDPEIQVPAGSLGRGDWLARIDERLQAMHGTRARIAAELVQDCAQLDRRINDLERQITQMTKAQAPQLLEISGCGALSAAKIIAEVAGIQRFADPAKLARYAGVAPVPVSSGAYQRHRLDRAGNRQLNCALHRIAITQARIHPPAREYLTRRVAEGKTNREARRCLKRHLINVIFRALTGQSQTISSGGPPALAAALT